MSLSIDRPANAPGSSLVRCLLRAVAACVVAAMLPVVAHAADVTEAAVRALIDQTDRAVAAKDLRALSQTISDDIDMVVSVTAGGSTQPMRMNKAEYMQAFQDIWQSGAQHSYRRSNTKIRPMGKTAVVTYDMAESFLVPGQAQALTSSSSLTATVEYVKGALQITKVRGSGSMK
jgi:ketosteroid isomerase-like protein